MVHFILHCKYTKVLGFHKMCTAKCEICWLVLFGSDKVKVMKILCIEV